MGEKTPTVAVAAVQSRDLAAEKTTPESMNWLLEDSQQTEALALVSQYYHEFFNDFWFSCSRLADYKDVTYLIDFDVLREYLEIDTVQEFSALLLNSLFNESSRPYAIPAGAFLELFEYIVRLSRLADKLADIPKKDPERAVRLMGLLLGVEETNEDDAEIIGEAVAHRLDSTAAVVKRLQEVWLSPRFRGVVSDFDPGDVASFKRILARMPRSGGSDYGRSKKDKRDALNLSIAVKSVRGQPQGEVRGYMLLSSTRIVQRLPRMILDYISRESDRREMLSELRAVLGECERAPVTMRGPDLSAYFPALHPVLAVNAELMGVFESSQMVMLKASDLSSEYHKIGDYFMRRTALLKGSAPDDAGALRLSLDKRFEEDVTRSLREIASEMLSVREKGFYRVEQQRATAVSIAYARREQGGELADLTDQLIRKSTGLLKLFGRFLVALESTPGFRYDVQTEPASEFRPFETFRITQEPAPDGHDPLASGEKYLPREGGATTGYFAIRWPVVCRVERFLRALRRLLVPLTADLRGDWQAAGRGLTFEYVHVDSPLREEGFVVFANEIAFGCPLGAFMRNKNWGRPHLSELHAAVREAYGVEARRQGFVVPPYFKLQQFRVNTQYGDFVFDIEPLPDESRLYLTVLSHYDLARQLAVLYQHTGQLYAFLEKLVEAVGPLLANYAPLPAIAPTEGRDHD
jgi:hypothetical protein